MQKSARRKFERKRTNQAVSLAGQIEDLHERLDESVDRHFAGLSAILLLQSDVPVHHQVRHHLDRRAVLVFRKQLPVKVDLTWRQECLQQ